MSDQHEENPDFAAGDVTAPDDASALVEDAADAPTEPTAAERAASETASVQDDVARRLAERTADLQRLQAEYANYKKRVDRDRDVARGRGVESVVSDLLPVLDSIDAAAQHDDLVGGFKLVADEIAKVTAKYGLITYGEVGEPFDPNVHEALMHMPYDGEHDVTVVAAVIQKGAKLHDRIIRPARVGVADPA